jgi:hypothetical protein
MVSIPREYEVLIGRSIGQPEASTNFETGRLLQVNNKLPASTPTFKMLSILRKARLKDKEMRILLL